MSQQDGGCRVVAAARGSVQRTVPLKITGVGIGPGRQEVLHHHGVAAFGRVQHLPTAPRRFGRSRPRGPLSLQRRERHPDRGRLPVARRPAQQRLVLETFGPQELLVGRGGQHGRVAGGGGQKKPGFQVQPGGGHARGQQRRGEIHPVVQDGRPEERARRERIAPEHRRLQVGAGGAAVLPGPFQVGHLAAGRDGIGAGRQQQARGRQLLGVAGQRVAERGLPVLVPPGQHGWIRFFQQCCQGFGPIPPRRLHQGRQSVCVALSRIGPTREEQADGRGAVLPAESRKEGAPAGTLDVRASVQHQRDHLEFPGIGRAVQGRGPLFVRRVGVGAPCQQQPDDGGLAVFSRLVQRPIAGQVEGLVRPPAGIEIRRDPIRIALPNGLLQVVALKPVEACFHHRQRLQAPLVERPDPGLPAASHQGHHTHREDQNGYPDGCIPRRTPLPVHKTPSV